MKHNRARTLILIILGIASLASGIYGAIFYGIILDIIARRDSSPVPDEQADILLAGSFAAPSVLLALILVGLLLRIGNWPWSKQASLLLAIISAIFVAASWFLLSGPAEAGETSQLLLLAAAGLGFALGCLPPYFHWKTSDNQFNQG